MRHSSRWFIGMTAGLVLLLSPAWAPASVLEIPADGATVSGIGVISGWKCDAGDITVSFDVGTTRFRWYTGAIPGRYERGRLWMMTTTALWPSGTGGYSVMGSTPPSSMTMTWSLPAATFSVVNFGQEFVTGAAGECTIEDFPSMGETATFAWNESTQHLELAEIMGAPEDPEDMEPDLAQFDGSWHAEANTTGSSCLPITEFDCEISNGDLSCLRRCSEAPSTPPGLWSASYTSIRRGNSVGPSRMGAGKAQ